MQSDADTFFAPCERASESGAPHTEMCLVDAMCRPRSPLLECQSVPAEQSNTPAEPRASERARQAGAGTAGAAPAAGIRKRSHNGWSIKREGERVSFFYGRGGGMGCRNKEAGIDSAASNAGLVVGDYRESSVLAPAKWQRQSQPWCRRDSEQSISGGEKGAGTAQSRHTGAVPGCPGTRGGPGTFAVPSLPGHGVGRRSRPGRHLYTIRKPGGVFPSPLASSLP